MHPREETYLKRKIEEKEEIILSTIKNVLIGKLSFQRHSPEDDEKLNTLAKYALSILEKQSGEETGLMIFQHTHKKDKWDNGLIEKSYIITKPRIFNTCILNIFKNLINGRKLNGSYIEDYEEIVFNICKYFEQKKIRKVDRSQKQQPDLFEIPKRIS